MTRLYTREADNPRIITQYGVCSRCRYKYDWKLLDARVLKNQHIQILCPSCRMDLDQGKPL